VHCSVCTHNRCFHDRVINLAAWQCGVQGCSFVRCSNWRCLLAFICLFFLLGKGELLRSLQWVVSVVLFVTLVLTLYVGEMRYGSKRWLNGVQVSEFSKLLLLPGCLKVLERICWLG